MLATAGFINYTTEETESEQEKDTVVQLLVDGIPVDVGEMVDVNTKITIVVSIGPKVQSVTKDVTVSLGGLTAEGAQEVVVTREGSVVFRETVEMGVDSITIKNQTGSGLVYYTVSVTGVKEWIIEEQF